MLTIPHSGWAAAREHALPFARALVPRVVELISSVAMVTASERHRPHYVEIALGKDEYVYSLADKHFIRVIKDRFELPRWRACGDWASVRVALYGESMETIVPEMVWFMVYRDNQWQRVVRDENGLFTYQSHAAEPPPYAIRCLNLDGRDMTD